MRPGKLGEAGGIYALIGITAKTTDITGTNGADVDLPSGCPPVVQILYGYNVDVSAATSYALTVVTATPTAANDVYLKDYNTITIKGAAVLASCDIIFLFCKLAPKDYSGSLHTVG